MSADRTSLSPSLVLIVDDAPDSLSLLSGILKDVYRVKIANNGEKALRIAAGRDQPDLILLDIMMPGMDGYEVCRRLKRDPATKSIPVIFLTAKSDIAAEESGLGLGAVDYITKPVSPPVMLARVRTHLQLKMASDFLRDKNAYLEQVISQRTFEIQTAQEVMFSGFASLAETRDNETGGHIFRTQHYVRALAEQLQAHPRFASFLTEQGVSTLFRSAPLHDIGKVGIPDNILLKPGRLDAAEYEIMKTHTSLGKEAIESAEKRLGVEVEFLRIAKEIIYSHHERWDGKGYPQGLSGERIPLAAQLMAVADGYDAMTSDRVYKKGVSHERAAEIITLERGLQFDPDVVDAFLIIQEEFRMIGERFTDEQ